MGVERCIMAKKEAQTDLWVYELLKEANLNIIVYNF